MKVQVGVMGSAGGRMRKDLRERAREVGRAIAEHDCVLVTGACPGLPYEAVCGCKQAGGLTAGISPTLCPRECPNQRDSTVRLAWLR